MLGHPAQVLVKSAVISCKPNSCDAICIILIPLIQADNQFGGY